MLQKEAGPKLDRWDWMYSDHRIESAYEAYKNIANKQSDTKIMARHHSSHSSHKGRVYYLCNS